MKSIDLDSLDKGKKDEQLSRILDILLDMGFCAAHWENGRRVFSNRSEASTLLEEISRSYKTRSTKKME